MNKKIISTLAFLALFLVLSCNEKKDDVYKIGVLAPLTGEAASYGKSTKQGVDLAVSELNNDKFLDKKIQIIYEDDKISAKDGVNALKKLIDSDHVPVVIGPFGSSVVLACAPVANQNKTVIISASATADSIANAGDYVFRIVPPNSRQGQDIADFSFHKLKSKKAAIIFQNNDYGITLRDAFQKHFTQLGGKILGIESSEAGATNFRTQLTKLKAVQPEVIFYPQHYAEGTITLKQAKELGMNAKFITADGAMTQELLTVAGNAAEGAYFSSMALGYGISDDLIMNLNTKFKAINNQEPDVYAAYYYEVTKIVAKAIKDSGYDADKIKNALYAMTANNAYKGVSGITSFDKNGEVNKSFYIYEAKKGKFELLK